VRSQINDTEKDLTSSRYRNDLLPILNTNIADAREHEKIAREIDKTRESICKKHRALKAGRIEEDIVLDRHFKSYRVAVSFRR